MANDESGIDTAVKPGTVAAAAAPSDAVAEESPARRSSTRSRMVLPAVLAVLVVALVAGLGWSRWQQQRADTLRTEAIDTTRDYAQTIATFDYQDLDANRDKVAGLSTPEFAGKYNEMVDALSRLVTDGQGQASGSVSDIGIAAIDGSHATVLAFVDQEAKNVIAPEGKSQKYRMVVTLTRDGDRWIVDNVETK